jgi:hypothetical protein
MKITLVPAFLLILSIVSCCKIFVKNFKVSFGVIPDLYDISLILSTQPSVIFFLIEAIP